MPTVWFALKRSLHCKTEPSDVHNTKTKSGNSHFSTILTKKETCRSGCSRSISNLKDVIHESTSKIHQKKSQNCSPKSVGSSEFLNPMTHEVILRSPCSKLKITANVGCSSSENYGSTFVGALSPRTPVPAGGHHTMKLYNNSPFRSPASRLRKPSISLHRNECFGFAGFAGLVGNGGRASHSDSVDSHGFSSTVFCHKCGEHFGKRETAEAHHISKHAVTELTEGDSSRRIIEIICRTSWIKSGKSNWRIERILKVHNTQKMIARFEEHREKVKKKASKLHKEHPRCIADGNELLRFYGTTLDCFLGMNGSCGLCVSEKCSVCRVLRNGFSFKDIKDDMGVYTTSTSERAFDSIEIDEERRFMRKSLIVCRVIAGRVHRSLENMQDLFGQSPAGFDSLAGKVGVYSNIEELYLFNPRALLPCFVVMCNLEQP